MSNVTAELEHQPEDAIDVVGREEFLSFRDVIADFDVEAMEIDRAWREADMLSLDITEATQDFGTPDAYRDELFEQHGLPAGMPSDAADSFNKTFNSTHSRHIAFCRSVARFTALREVYDLDASDRYIVDYGRDEPRQWHQETLEASVDGKTPTEQWSVVVNYARDARTHTYEQTLVQIYTQAETSTRGITEAAAEYIRGGVEQSRSFLDWAEAALADEDGTYRSLLKSFASDIVDDQWIQVLPDAFNSVMDGLEDELVGEFSDLILRDETHEVHQTLQEWRRLFAAEVDGVEGFDQALYERLVQNRENWPPILVDAYERHVGVQRDALRTRMRDLASAASDKTRIVPTERRLEGMIDAINAVRTKKIVKDKRVRKKGRQHSQVKSADKRASSGERDISKSLVAERPPEFELAVLVPGDGHSILYSGADAQERLDRMITKYARGYSGDSQLPETLQTAMNVLVADPRGPGTKKLSMWTIPSSERNKKAVTLSRFSPLRHPEVPTKSDTATRTRIVYTLIGGSVAVYQILHHDEFDNLYESG